MSATVVCTYRVKPEREQEFRKLLQRHWPTLRELDVVTDEIPIIFRGSDDGRPFYMEIFHWKSSDALNLARQHPDVVSIWEPMDGCCEARGDKPNMEFPHVERVRF